ncbi:phosphate ABC transporter ATP-binding protein PstB [Streptomyces sp. NPDC049881]|uniref:phosphate ABC transporter ATP-binding protein PstB n=1 Tax=unclassified Streptomyces TaxID=2593676 RepID=UPI0034352C37
MRWRQWAPVVFDVEGLHVGYGGRPAVRDVSLTVHEREITALIGPSGCGKSSVLRSLNRMNDFVPGARVTGRVTYRGDDLYAPDTDPDAVRRRVGMVFQRPNPFPKSVYDNVAYGLRAGAGRRARLRKPQLDERVEEALTGAALWDEVKDKLKSSGLALSGGQQQRLCIARAIAVRPDVVLMDEPCGALDPVATARIEDLMLRLRNEFTLVIVTHHMHQAARVSDRTAFFTADTDSEGVRHGRLVEYDTTEKIFNRPADRRTEDYISGRFG